MALEVEDGTGKATAESYVSVAACEAYCSGRGLTFASGATDAKEAALRRATSYIDGVYGPQFVGYRRFRRAQALEWPRAEALDEANLQYVPVNQIPTEVISATCEAAVRELAKPGSLSPDLKRGGAIRSVRAGSVSVEYAGNAPAETVYKVIDRVLAPLLAGRASGFVGHAVRG